MRWLLAGVVGGATAGVVTHEILRDWGASDLERVQYLPGDELVPDPADSSTLAVDIGAPADEVWRWLVQIGQDRAGMYSYDRLEKLVGLHISSAERVHGEWQSLAVGDTVRLIPAGWMGLRDGLALPVAQLVPGRSIVLRMAPPTLPWNAVWSFHVLPAGGHRCRLISRSRGARARGLPRAVDAVMNPVAWLMTRRMLVGIKERAERADRVHQRSDHAVVTPGRPRR
jgi:hypothetical protein